MRNTAFCLAIIAGISLHFARGGSAVATGNKPPYIVASYGYSVETAQRRALLKCSAKGGTCRILAATDKLGYGAIAVGDKGTGSVIAASLGNNSRAEAATLAIEKCVQHGGRNPKIIREFQDPPGGRSLSVR